MIIKGKDDGWRKVKPRISPQTLQTPSQKILLSLASPSRYVGNSATEWKFGQTSSWRNAARPWVRWGRGWSNCCSREKEKRDVGCTMIAKCSSSECFPHVDDGRMSNLSPTLDLSNCRFTLALLQVNTLNTKKTIWLAIEWARGFIDPGRIHEDLAEVWCMMICQRVDSRWRNHSCTHRIQCGYCSRLILRAWGYRMRWVYDDERMIHSQIFRCPGYFMGWSLQNCGWFYTRQIRERSEDQNCSMDLNETDLCATLASSTLQL